MFFSLCAELINMRRRKVTQPLRLHQSYVAPADTQDAYATGAAIAPPK